MGHIWHLAASLLLVITSVSTVHSKQCEVKDNSRFDCLPGSQTYANPREQCEKIGCCWKPDGKAKSGSGIGVPFCFYPTDYVGYNISSLKEIEYGYRAILVRTGLSGWPSDVKALTLDAWFETSTRIHIKIYDPASMRYEVPIEVPSTPLRKSLSTDYDIKFSYQPFAVAVVRKSTGAILLDSSVAPLLFADQFIQLSTRLDSPYVYGLGEHKSELLHKATSYQRMAMWARDQAPFKDMNLYGSHPFYMNIEHDSANTHGVFLLNSNAMDVDLTPLPGLTFRTIGGILDLYIFTGPSPDDVVRQYSDVIGRPQMPPYWALGFHLCRYGYQNATRLQFIIDRNRALGIPYEVQWSDIDYMEGQRDWTSDPDRYSNLSDIVKDLHKHNQKYVIIVDPGISNAQPAGKYRPYDEGMARNVFIKNSSGQPLIAKVWPGTTVFPDFTHPNASEWWFDMAREFHDKIQFDGLWIDMNEPSNFVEGSISNCTSSNLDKPPYIPAITGDGKLESNTICASAKQYYSSHYNLHNLYGLTEANATNSALKKILQKRSVVISRSSYPSLGRYAGHWTGDVFSTWEDLYYSIPAILEYQLYVIPLVGADICGFNGETNEELCIRWMQLGAFYPFMRNHNDDTSRDQDPGAWSEKAQDIMRLALIIRYTLLPYFYTQFYISSQTGEPVIRPLFFLYPEDMETYGIDDEFIWGNAILVTPALFQGQKEVNAYFPRGIWYDAYDSHPVSNSSRGQRLNISAPLETINFFFRGGSVVVTQAPSFTTVDSRKNPFGVWVAYNETSGAEGMFYWDDGESLDTAEKGRYVKINFYATKNTVQSQIIRIGYELSEPFIADHVRCFGVEKEPSEVRVNNEPTKDFYYLANRKELTIFDQAIPLLKPFKVTWN